MLRTLPLISRTLLIMLAFLSAYQSVQAQDVAVRNNAPRVGQQEILMMRHSYLEPGKYDYWKQQSQSYVWPWYERLGARIIGDFEILYPKSADESPRQDEAIRLARYASYEHWQATRPNSNDNPTGGYERLSGTGELNSNSSIGIRNRRTVALGSKEAIFLQGYMAQTRPLYMPGTGETFQTSSASGSANAASQQPVALKAAQANDEILVLAYQKVKKGSFEEFHAIARDGMWPYLEKIGARPVGQWRIAYLPESTAVESPDYDEVYTLVRYANMEHYDSISDNAVSLGGDGPDYKVAVQALTELNALTLASSLRFLKGPLFGSPPTYAPVVNTNYSLSN